MTDYDQAGLIGIAMLIICFFAGIIVGLQI
jgi:hypothetical protein